MRTAAEYQADYNWLTPAEFGERVGMTPDAVREIIRDRTSEALSPPRVMDVSRSSRPRYRIHPEAVEAYHQESVARLEEHLTS